MQMMVLLAWLVGGTWFGQPFGVGQGTQIACNYRRLRRMLEIVPPDHFMAIFGRSRGATQALSVSVACFTEQRRIPR